MTLLGEVSVVQGCISGWAGWTDRPGAPVELFVWFDGRFFGRLLADEHRPDLGPGGGGDGHATFDLPVPRALVDGQAHELRMADGDGRMLPGTPRTIHATDCADHVLPTDTPSDGEDVVMLAIARDEGRYIEEWIAHHHGLGIGRFVIYDNDSSDGMAQRLGGNPRLAGIVEVVPWPAGAFDPAEGPQRPAYRDAMSRLGRSGWVAILDLDEFLVLKHDSSIHSMLRRYRDLSGITIPWKVFGSSGLAARDDRLVTERFHYAMPAPLTKTIARQMLLAEPIMHHHSMIERPIADELRRPLYVPDRGPVPSYRSAQINHYFTKSREEWAEKRQRGRAGMPRGAPGFQRSEAQFYSHDQCIEFDRWIDRHAWTTRAALDRLFPGHVGAELARHPPLLPGTDRN
ncbi:glycosyl transferase family 2 [Stella humosa]|uniref:Glycosyl transferase family 2 n=2 Tax=Stella humosa TaxID=94 RepID=A0A3N1M7C8_9PROT|nr:glycosyltransferase family 2 protein [Stella humosa]ROP99612.1 glycosyl transferase family 2 [Stella humosa]BBK31163.1 hypothetical protein STHU_17970 [Stella humosa]